MKRASVSDTRGGISINYYRAFLEEKPKQAAPAAQRPAKTVSAQQYEQRQYTSDFFKEIEQ